VQEVLVVSRPVLVTPLNQAPAPKYQAMLVPSEPRVQVSEIGITTTGIRIGGVRKRNSFTEMQSYSLMAF